MIDNLISNISDKSIQNFIRSRNSSFKEYKEDLSYVLRDKTLFQNLYKLGEISYDNSDELLVFYCAYKGELSSKSSKRIQFEIAKKVLKEDFKDGAIFVFYDEKGKFRFSFIRKNYGDQNNKLSNWRRFTYFIDKEQQTNRTFTDTIGSCNFDSLDNIQERFNLEPVSKEFFKGYKNQYEKFCNYMQTNKVMLKNFEPFLVDGTNKAIRDYVKKMLGRIVFLQFLQKKGWMGVPKDSKDWIGGDKNFLENLYKNCSKEQKDNFLDKVLEPLFFTALNRPRKNDFYDTETSLGVVKIPYLNGGLFERDILDEPDSKFPSSFFKELFEFFNQYNFTIDENDPNDAEIGVDPEMLGHIFENLLEDNKDKGAFYTPKEIVHYMCQESLIEYLSTSLKYETIDEREQISTLIKFHNLSHGLVPKIKDIDKYLDDVKICDPAIGSGAFPMGLLQEVFHAKQTLWLHKNQNLNDFPASEVKLNIIQNSIYGVDIEKGAVDIARLRFWLSLVVDESEPSALPNLDYKIVVGNSLVSKLGDDIIEIDWNLDQTSHGLFGAELAKQKSDLLQKISKKQKEFFKPNSEKNILASEIRNLKIDLLITQLELMVKTKGNDTIYSLNTKNVARQTESKNQTISWKNSIKDLQSLKANPDVYLHFFDWKLDFPEIMNEQVAKTIGFDIVIGNPPYIGQKGNNDLFRPVKESKLGIEFHQRRMDYFYFFFHQALNLSISNGVINFITTNYYLTATYADKLRKDIKERASIIQLINFNEYKIFESATGQHNLITLLIKYNKNHSVKVISTNKSGFSNSYTLNKILSGIDEETNYFQMPDQNIFEGKLNYIRLQNETSRSSGIDSILEIVKNDGKPLSDICFLTTGVQSGAEKLTQGHINKYDIAGNIGEGIFILNDEEIKKMELSEKDKVYLKPYFKNSDIHKWITNEHSIESLIYYTSKTKKKIGTNLLANFEKYKLILINRNTRSGTPIITSSLYDRFVDGNYEISYVMVASAFKRGEYYCVSYARDEEYFISPKIVAPQRSALNTFGYNEAEWFGGTDIHFIITKDKKVKLKYILALLNSKLYYRWLYHRGKRKGQILELVLAPLSEIPIKITDGKTQTKFENITDKIISEKKEHKDTSALEQEIDNLVYKLYELTYEEVKVVDPEFSLTPSEYDAINLD